MKPGVSISLRMSKKDSEIIRNFAELKGLSVSEFLREAALRHVFSEIAGLEYEEARLRYSESAKQLDSLELRQALGLMK